MHDRSGETVMRQSKEYHVENDIDYAFELCRLVLKPLGVWSLIYRRTSRWEKAVSVVLLVTCTSCLLSLIVPLCCQILLGNIGGKAKIKWLGSACNCSLSALKYMFIVLNRATFTRCIELMEKDWRTVKNEQHRDLMVKQATFSRMLIMMCCAFIFSGGFSFHIMLPMSKRRVVGNHTVKALAYPGYDRFFDIQSSPTYEIVYCVQCFAGFFRHNVTAASFTLAVFFITHICGQIQIQIMRLEELNIASPEKNSDHNVIIGDIIQNHTEILRYAKTIGNSFSEIIFMEIVAATFIICIAEYCWLLEWKDSETISMITYSVFVLSMTFNALIYCYIGQVLTDQCAQIGFAGYEFDWYNLPPPKARDLVLLDAISLYPPTFIGGKLCELSLNTFTIILKTSMVYLNFMRAVTYL
ncbi:odorant receptor 13a-like isoform X3 [Halictus rubicundus]|uniref:odorant receptor 13a-like isoform X3 n=1 Tax=Halictus rubicundus TaxID=77578 RepID=UPI004036F4E4